MTPSDLDYAVIAYTLGIYAAIVLSPGPNFALVTRLALQGRTRASGGAIVGMATAATFYAILAMVGLAALLNEIGWLARAVQICGGLYLMYLGLCAWASSSRDHPSENGGLQVSSGRREFVTGLKLGAVVNLSNPKGIAFFVGLYAVAVPLDATLGTRLAILTGGAILELGWYSLVAFALSRGPFRKAYRACSVWIERAIGTVLIFFGARMVLSR